MDAPTPPLCSISTHPTPSETWWNGGCFPFWSVAKCIFQVVYLVRSRTRRCLAPLVLITVQPTWQLLCVRTSHWPLTPHYPKFIVLNTIMRDLLAQLQVLFKPISRRRVVKGRGCMVRREGREFWIDWRGSVWNWRKQLVQNISGCVWPSATLMSKV